MEEDIKIVEEIVCSIWDDVGCDVYLGKRERDALNNLIKDFQDMVRWKKEEGCSLQEVYDLFVPKSKIKKLKEENEVNIDKMRPYRHQGPFDFGVLNGIDECCRKLLEDKE